MGFNVGISRRNDTTPDSTATPEVAETTEPAVSPVNVPQIIYTDTDLKKETDNEVLLNVIAGEIPASEYTLSCAVRRYAELNGESARDTLLQIANNSDLQGNVREAALDCLNSYLRLGSAQGVELSENFLNILLDKNAPASVRESAAENLEIGVTSDLSRRERKQLLRLADGKSFISEDADEEQAANIRATAARLAGREGAEIALSIAEDETQPTYLRAVMAAELVEISEPKHRERIFNALERISEKQTKSDELESPIESSDEESAAAELSTSDPQAKSLAFNLALTLTQLGLTGKENQIESLFQNSGPETIEGAAMLKLLAAGEDINASVQSIVSDSRLSDEVRAETVSTLSKQFNDETITELFNLSINQMAEAEGTISSPKVIDATFKVLDDRADPRRIELAESILSHYGTGKYETTAGPVINKSLKLLDEHAPERALEYSKQLLQNRTTDIATCVWMPALEIIKNRGTADEYQIQLESIAKDSNRESGIRTTALEQLETINNSLYQDTLEAIKSDSLQERFVSNFENRKKFNVSTPSREEDLKLLSKNTELSYSARHALTRLIDANDPEIDEQLREILSTSKEPTVKLAIAQALTEKGDEVGVNALLEIPWASNNLVEPHRALAQSPSPTASVAYYQLLCSDSAYQADIARHVLEGVCENPEKFTELKSRWEQYASQPEVDPKLASEMRGYVSDLQKASELDIEHTYRFSPQTLKKIISHRELDQQTPRAATNNKEAIVIFPKADDSNAFVNMDRQIRSLFEQGYDVKFFESGSDTHLVELLAERSKAGKQTDLLVLGGHGMREMLSLGASDPAEVGLSVPLDLVIDPTDVPAFQNSGANGVLKSGGKVVLVSCSTGNGTKNNDNLANTMREIFPQAAKHGIIAPQYPTTFEAFEFNRKGEVTSVQYSVDPYLAKLEVPDPIDIEHA